MPTSLVRPVARLAGEVIMLMVGPTALQTKHPFRLRLKWRPRCRLKLRPRLSPKYCRRSLHREVAAEVEVAMLLCTSPSSQRRARARQRRTPSTSRRSSFFVSSSLPPRRRRRLWARPLQRRSSTQCESGPNAYRSGLSEDGWGSIPTVRQALVRAPRAQGALVGVRNDRGRIEMQIRGKRMVETATEVVSTGRTMAPALEKVRAGGWSVLN
mmetsp:Transcript_72918/g.207755  ORF Transcript_72918/g.207755 Transcript_72918/m.207755 type:complete len:212 (-) Transcript_72918:745-1380(-)